MFNRFSILIFSAYIIVFLVSTMTSSNDDINFVISTTQLKSLTQVIIYTSNMYV